MVTRISSHEALEPHNTPPPASLFRRLSGIAQGHLPRSNSVPHPSFCPRFDLEEHEHSYELYGELPGAKRDRINVKTVDEHNIEVFGNVVRHSVESKQLEKMITPTPIQPQQQQQPATEPFVKIWTPEIAASSSASSPQAGVAAGAGLIPPMVLEDESEEDGGVITKTHGRAYIYAEADEEVRRRERAAHAGPYHVKHLVSECHVGDFHRKFHLAAPLKLDLVTARFEDGVLHVTLPKNEGWS
ncbi:MAG: hypothetical protein M1818_001658 [Claussenomyces sp. TS43310]|nr:MAG: hypothetical protein M1818_001658 [Claussenomyces sp. TS43310]